MSYMYVTDQGATFGYKGHRFEIRRKDGTIQYVPAETLEVVQIFGNVQMTTQCVKECLQRGITVIFYSLYGAYFGRLSSSNHVNVARQRIQVHRSEDDALKLAFSKRIINAKIKNQIVIAQRYSRSNRDLVKNEIAGMKDMRDKIDICCDSVETLIGYEGQAARYYFQALGKLVESDFRFERRSRRPPEDAFNSMLSLGYSIIMNEIYGKIEAKGLNPYFGMLHKDREKHPTLASDLMEEWRAVLVDSTVMSMVNGHETTLDDFYQDEEHEGVFLKQDFFRKFVRKLETKIFLASKYLSYIDYKVSFRRALDFQVNQFVKMLETGDAEIYEPVMIR